MWLFLQPSFPQIFKQLVQKCMLASDLLETWRAQCLLGFTEGLANESSVQ